jgi:hypothetical protein
VGPAQLAGDPTGNGFEWAQYSSKWILPMVSSGPSTIGRVTLPMALNGPSIPHNVYYRWPQMGPVLQVEHLADDLQRAQQCSQW